MLELEVTARSLCRYEVDDVVVVVVVVMVVLVV